MAARALSRAQSDGSIPSVRFRPLGVIYRTENYGQCPTPLVLDEMFVRIFFSERDRENKSFVSWVDFDPANMQIVGSRNHVLNKGPLGAFDQDGAIPSYAEFRRGDVDLYYSGWFAGASGCYQNAMGLARETEDGTFRRVHDGPLMDRTKEHPYLAVTPCFVGRRMWYIDGLGWQMIEGRPEPIYTIAYAEKDEYGEIGRSDDIEFPRHHALECFSRPWVTGEYGEDFEMLFSCRSANNYRDGKNAYRIGYATSPDGFQWTRHADPAIPRTPGFDDSMQCYGATFEMRGKRYLLYNGSTFGKRGFALAVQE